jgi:hypothetical protein
MRRAKVMRGENIIFNKSSASGALESLSLSLSFRSSRAAAASHKGSNTQQPESRRRKAARVCASERLFSIKNNLLRVSSSAGVAKIKNKREKGRTRKMKKKSSRGTGGARKKGIVHGEMCSTHTHTHTHTTLFRTEQHKNPSAAGMQEAARLVRRHSIRGCAAFQQFQTIIGILEPT